MKIKCHFSLDTFGNCRTWKKYRRDFFSFSFYFASRSFFFFFFQTSTTTTANQVKKKKGDDSFVMDWPCKEMADDRFGSALKHLTYKTVLREKKKKRNVLPFFLNLFPRFNMGKGGKKYPGRRQKKKKKIQKIKSNFPALSLRRVPFDHGGRVRDTFSSRSLTPMIPSNPFFFPPVFLFFFFSKAQILGEAFGIDYRSCAPNNIRCGIQEETKLGRLV